MWGPFSFVVRTGKSDNKLFLRSVRKCLVPWTSIKAGQEPEKDGRFIYYLPGILFIPNHEAGHTSNDVADALYDLIATPQDKENTLRNMSAYSGGTVKVRKDLLNKGLDSVPNESFLVKEEYAVSRENISDFLKTHALEWMQGRATQARNHRC